MALPTLWIEFTETCIPQLTPLVPFISTTRIIINNGNIMTKIKKYRNKMLDI